jgi:RNA polymerase-binding protein DksA
MLSTDLIEKQKKALLVEKERLEKKIAELKKFPDYGQNEDDNAKETADYENNLSVEEQLNYLLNKVKRALESIEDGSYGKCQKCSKIIEQGRLEIMPYAELCISCRKTENGR